MDGNSKEVASRGIDYEFARHILELLEELRLATQYDTVKTDPDLERRKIRLSTIGQTDGSDPFAKERIFGTSDLVSINYLSRGLRAANSVCHINIPEKGGYSEGTGFLVAHGLLATNNHVIPDKASAAQAKLSFDYEFDVDGVAKEKVEFGLAPYDIFFTDINHDITFVAVNAFSDTGVPLERFGFLPFIPLSGKGLHGEWVTLVQHPFGKPKQIAIRENQIVEVDRTMFNDIGSKFIHYTTDTEAGSSGSPVLNDQWQVVAVHHGAIRNPFFTEKERHSDDPPARGAWLVNEGVRVSAISKLLERNRFSDINASRILDLMAQGLGLTPQRPMQAAQTDHFPELEARRAKPKSHWTGFAGDDGLGYNDDFLNKTVKWDDIVSTLPYPLAPSDDGNNRLDYLHFSAAVHEERKFAAMTAVNIMGAALVNPGKRSDSWRRDIRMEPEFQPADNFYKKKLGNDPVQFSRGHLVRRVDPCWSTKSTEKARIDEAITAEMHTFHFANAAPQVQRYNNVDWGDLEDYILDRAQTADLKMSVFTGPIFRDDDPEYGRSREDGPWKIPITYWKVVVLDKPDNRVSAAGFLIGQVQYVQALYESRVFTSLSPYTANELRDQRIQVPIETIEEETGLNFAAIKEFDAQNALESTRRSRFIRSAADISI